MTDKQCERCGEKNPAEIHTCSPQEPVAWRFKIGKNNDYLVSTKKPGIVYSDGNGGTRVDNGEPLYTAAPHREWQGLTDDDCEEVERWVEFKEDGSGRIPTRKLILYIEAKLKAKNHD